ncbi:hypothetical protein BJ322DRAFT_724319 [Thelephora terrestris]|uniref:Uncharacterized protein n=1 Tax=Thelephora terrestris TaxID=56493 RepID=A0A9P6HIP4_9AGAM|nr:hypothetical protein BJ322DRAFT_724319 [Thelephora terrestris]
MQQFDLKNPLHMPERLLDMFFEQLLGHQGPGKLAGEVKDRHAWITETYSSYLIWLSYAIFETTTTINGLLLKKENLTPATNAHKKYLKEAPLELIQAYINWATPKKRATLWREYYEGRYIDYFISPVHFWFFAHCVLSQPNRPRSPRSMDDFFLHPLFLPADTRYHASLVVPEYFFKPPADFAGLRNPRSAFYYVFPNFAPNLFDYARKSLQSEMMPFADFYLPLNQPWSVGAGFEGTDPYPFIEPDPVVKRNWRWADMLVMLYGLSNSPMRGRPRWCGPAPRRLNATAREPGQGDDVSREIVAYIDNFGRMAKEWYRIFISESRASQSTR